MRIIKYAITNHIFYEPTFNEVAHTAFSAILVTDPEFRADIAFEVEEALPVATNLVEAHEKWDMNDGRRVQKGLQHVWLMTMRRRRTITTRHSWLCCGAGEDHRKRREAGVINRSPVCIARG